MAQGIQVSGLVTVKVVVPNGSIATLGEQTDMTEVREQAFFHNVPGDRNGGPQGPPIEIQWLGAICVIRCDLSSWDSVVVDSLRKRAANATLGTTIQTEVGKLMLKDNGIRLILDCANRPLNFPCCIVREPIQYGKGTKFSTMAIEFEAHKKPDGTKAGVLFDTDIA